MYPTPASPKDPGEAIFVTFDFTTVLAGDSITGTPTVACAVEAGTDGSPGAMISGTATVNGGVVQQRVVGGIAGNDYRLTCTANTVAGPRTIKLALLLPVRTA